MKTFGFPALGTQWTILIDHDEFGTADEKAILTEVETFERRFSRFLPESEVNAFRKASAGTYDISERFSVMLTRALLLRDLTHGVYDPAVGGLLERAGYGMAPEEGSSPTDFVLPRWSLSRTTLTLDGPTAFDLGGIGKGYCIDLVGSILLKRGYQFFLVEGGGDMYGTTKRDGSPYRVALEYPGRPDTAFGTLELNHQAVAVSDTFKRRWPASVKAGRDEQKWHHIIDPVTKQPIAAVIGCAALGQTAFDADSMTSGLFLAGEGQYRALREALGTEFVVFRENGTIVTSPSWPGELFT